MHHMQLVTQEVTSHTTVAVLLHSLLLACREGGWRCGLPCCILCFMQAQYKRKQRQCSMINSNIYSAGGKGIQTRMLDS